MSCPELFIKYAEERAAAISQLPGGNDVVAPLRAAVQRARARRASGRKQPSSSNPFAAAMPASNPFAAAMPASNPFAAAMPASDLSDSEIAYMGDRRAEWAGALDGGYVDIDNEEVGLDDQYLEVDHHQRRAPAPAPRSFRDKTPAPVAKPRAPRRSGRKPAVTPSVQRLQSKRRNKRILDDTIPDLFGASTQSRSRPDNVYADNDGVGDDDDDVEGRVPEEQPNLANIANAANPANGAKVASDDSTRSRDYSSAIDQSSQQRRALEEEAARAAARADADARAAAVAEQAAAEAEQVAAEAANKAAASKRRRDDEAAAQAAKVAAQANAAADQAVANADMSSRRADDLEERARQAFKDAETVCDALKDKDACSTNTKQCKWRPKKGKLQAKCIRKTTKEFKEVLEDLENRAENVEAKADSVIADASVHFEGAKAVGDPDAAAEAVAIIEKARAVKDQVDVASAHEEAAEAAQERGDAASADVHLTQAAAVIDVASVVVEDLKERIEKAFENAKATCDGKGKEDCEGNTDCRWMKANRKCQRKTREQFGKMFAEKVDAARDAVGSIKAAAKSVVEEAVKEGNDSVVAAALALDEETNKISRKLGEASRHEKAAETAQAAGDDAAASAHEAKADASLNEAAAAMEPIRDALEDVVWKMKTASGRTPKDIIALKANKLKKGDNDLQTKVEGWGVKSDPRTTLLSTNWDNYFKKLSTQEDRDRLGKALFQWRAKRTDGEFGDVQGDDCKDASTVGDCMDRSKRCWWKVPEGKAKGKCTEL